MIARTPCIRALLRPRGSAKVSGSGLYRDQRFVHALRLADQPALCVMRPQFAQLRELLRRLHPFGDDVAMQGTGHADDGTDDGEAARIIELAYETLVDLDRVERQFVQVAQVRITCAEIVERNF